MEVDDSKQNALADILEDLPREERLVVFARFQHDLDSIAQVAEKARRSCYEISGRVKNWMSGTGKAGCWQSNCRPEGWDWTSRRHGTASTTA